MDRNSEDWLNAGSLSRSLSARRAWIEISVSVCSAGLEQSLSARRAWIEMSIFITLKCSPVVALRKESVDRNTQRRDFKRLGLLSLSARRAWIEIPAKIKTQCKCHGRSPQGERG